MRRLSVTLLCALVVAPAAAARPLLGVFGNVGRFDRQAGRHTLVGHTMVGGRGPLGLRVV